MLEQFFRDMADTAQDAARQPEFAVVRRRGGRRRVRRRVGAAALAFVAFSGLASVAVWGTGSATDSFTTSASPSQPPLIDGARILNLESADGQHIYMSVERCVTCGKDLVATDDGGKTWRSLGDVDATRTDVTVVGPEVLLAYSRTRALADTVKKPDQIVEGGGTPVVSPLVSVDGGRNWKDVTVDGDSVAKVSAGMRAIDCDSLPSKNSCGIYAVDPATGTVRQTPSQPPLDRVDLIETPATAGIWVRGVDPHTDRPATAVSHDGGATWNVGHFDAEPTNAKGVQPDVATTDGMLAFAMFIDDGAVRVYRSTDSGETWTRTNNGTNMPDPLSGPSSFVTFDGTHVVTAIDGENFTYLASADGREYAPLNIPALPALGHSPEAVTKTTFLFNGLDVIYTSPDGRVWTPRPLR
ncbi:sialidase family protein [Asanoa siamensis]|uniref:BNR/Asp-box repeat protein n=1 Tax=Asanoa siamensis TaxID=926357 RepID=A0ABQ4CVH9_9ACTN|nr:sialidase family protein [Asanoa siamensis]GIF75290.1 hypothetical protein Asi02nite_48080 [Asanoa siamensis]